jgi:hypothetical protein
VSIITDLINYTRLARELRLFLRGTVTLEQSKELIAARLRNRENNFLSLVQKRIYQNPRSPFLKLLNIAGCKFEDIKCLVEREGIENTLHRLHAAGVYLSWEEFKQKKEVVRGTASFRFDESEFNNPFQSVYYQVQSSGSRSAGTRTTFDLDHQLAMSYYCLPMLAVNDALDVPLGIWKSILPAAAGIGDILRQYKVGKPVVRWFTPVDANRVRLSLQHRLAMKFIIYGSRALGAKIPGPEYVGFEDAERVAQWIAVTRKESGGCAFLSSPNAAVKICRAASEKGLDIEGTRFIVGGEPLTPAKREQIEAAGASVSPRYAISEIGRIGCGCLKNSAADDIHLFHDSVALIQHRRKVEHSDIFVDSLIFTTLLPTAPKILLNVESDDCGTIETRNCDCLLDQLGFNRHLHDIRSYSKLTGIGMTIMGTDFIRILEEVLPRKYGGGATDYQLLEEEDNNGQTRLSLIISPAIGAIDETDVVTTVLAELRRNAHGGKLAAGIWSEGKLLQIKRMQPISRMGKVMTLHQMKTQ